MACVYLRLSPVMELNTAVMAAQSRSSVVSFLYYNTTVWCKSFIALFTTDHFSGTRRAVELVSVYQYPEGNFETKWHLTYNTVFARCQKPRRHTRWLTVCGWPRRHNQPVMLPPASTAQGSPEVTVHLRLRTHVTRWRIHSESPEASIKSGCLTSSYVGPTKVDNVSVSFVRWPAW